MPELAIDGDFCHWLITSPSMSACYDHLPIVIVWDGAGIPVRFMDNIVNIACLKCALDKAFKFEAKSHINTYVSKIHVHWWTG